MHVFEVSNIVANFRVASFFACPDYRTQNSAFVGFSVKAVAQAQTTSFSQICHMKINYHYILYE